MRNGLRSIVILALLAGASTSASGQSFMPIPVTAAPRSGTVTLAPVSREISPVGLLPAAAEPMLLLLV
jgi:hypothetical protein